MSDVRDEQIQGTTPDPSLEEVLSTENVWAAWQAVKANAGAPGVDGMNVEKTAEHLRKHGQEIWEKVRQGTYTPGAILAVEIPKANGGTRKLGIPNVQDRLIQQALHQVLSSRWEPLFSDSSYGFRPNRSAHDAIRRARDIVMSGRNWVVAPRLHWSTPICADYVLLYKAPSDRGLRYAQPTRKDGPPTWPR